MAKTPNRITSAALVSRETPTADVLTRLADEVRKVAGKVDGKPVDLATLRVSCAPSVADETYWQLRVGVAPTAE